MEYVMCLPAYFLTDTDEYFLLFNHRILSKNIKFSSFLHFLLLSLQEVPKKKMFQQLALFLSTAIFIFIFVHLVNVCSILKCKYCVYLYIEDMIDIQHSLWHNCTNVHMYVHTYVCMYVRTYGHNICETAGVYMHLCFKLQYQLYLFKII